MMGKILASLFIFALVAASLFAAMESAGGEVTSAVTCAISPSSVSAPVATSVQLSVSCYSSGNEVACPQMSWSSTIGAFTAKSPPVTFNSGTVAGSGAITASSSDADGSKFTCSIPAAVLPGSPSVLKISPKIISLSTGSLQQFTAVLYDQYGNTAGSPDSSRPVVWVASENIGKVSSAGIFSALSAGKGTVSATYALTAATKISDSAEVTVSGSSMKYCVISPQNSKLTVAQSMRVSAKCYYYSGSEPAAQQEVPCPTITWSVSDGNMAESPSVPATGSKEATFTAGKTAGQATVTATMKGQSDPSPASTNSCTALVNIIAGAPYSISISPGSATLQIGGTKTFAASAKDSFGNEITGAEVAWSAAGGVGSVDSSGKFTASSAGTGTVTASVRPSGTQSESANTISASAPISVQSSSGGSSSGGSGSSGSNSGGAAFASSSMVSFTCAGQAATVVTRIFRPNATALVEIFHMETTPSTKVFSRNVSNNQNASFTPASSGDYSLHVTVGTDQRNADFYVPQCTPSTVNVTKNVTIELSPPASPPTSPAIPPKTQTGSQGQGGVSSGSVAQQEGAIFGLPLAWVLVAAGILIIIAAYFLLAGKKAE